MSNYIFTYQHSCKKGVEAYILKNSAFKSNITKKENNKIYLPFLGESYYYWEENPKAAHSWGKRRYENNYNVVEYVDAKIDRENLLDFLNRRDIAYFIDLIDKYKNKRPNSKNWKIANWIEFFKSLDKTIPGIFPFKYFRADENLPDASLNSTVKSKTDFNTTGYYTFLDPLIMICAVEKCDLNCSKKHISF